MTDASRPYLDPEALARVAHLELQAREIVEGLISGRHRSPFHGQSVEFAQHREYVPGDDLRHIDWSVWAKSDRLYIKQYEEETNLRATILLDVSESMGYGENVSKYDYACALSACLSYLLLRQSDSVGLTTFDSDVVARIPRRNQVSHLRVILQAMTSRRPNKKTDLKTVLEQIADQEQRPGLIVLVSDLFAERQSVLKGLSMLRHRRHDVVVFHVLHDDEIDFLFEGATRFEGMESGDQLLCDPRALRTAYLEALHRYLTDLRRLSGQTGIDYRLTRTSDSMGTVLSSLLHERLRH
ncbi:MAG: DUF58 domain-containing protein [Planctomycetota bacterium]